MFILYFLGVGLPCCWIFCQFWLCEEAQCVYLRRHLGSPSFIFFIPIPASDSAQGVVLPEASQNCVDKCVMLGWVPGVDENMKIYDQPLV